MFDGKSFGEEMVAVVKSYVDRATAPLIARIADLESRPPLKGDPGKDADPYVPDAAAISAELDAIVARRLADIPAPQDGKSLTVADVAPMIEGLVAKAVAAIPPAKDGVGAAGALIDRDGGLVLTLTNGEARNLGPVVGKDADQGAIERTIREAVAQIPVPKDGRDALGFDDMQFEHDGERGFTLKFARGEQVKTFPFRLPATIYRGVWREGPFEKGDAVTWAGSLWVAQKDTDAKPDSGDGWQLAVKRGRDGKDTVAR